MAADPSVGLQPVEIIVELAGYEYVIPPLPAVEWLTAVLADDGGRIVPGLLERADQSAIWLDFVNGAFDGEELATVERAALEVAAGRPWWEADRLIRNLMEPGNRAVLYGELMLRGLDLQRLSLSAALDAIYALIRRLISHDEAALARFDAGLSAIPAGVKAEELEEQTTTEEEFAAMMLEQQQMFGG